MPKSKSRDTKEAILLVALKLFSERGYDGVSIRDIANEIGIRESAIYKHYSSKQDIFNSILEDIESRYQNELSTITLSYFEVEDLRGQLFRICTSMFQYYLKSEYGSQLRRLLTIEQFRTSEISSLFRDLIIEKGLEYITSVFDGLIDAQIYINADPQIMALQFYSPLYLLLSKYDDQPEKFDEALSCLDKHITQFNKIYLKDEIR